MENTTVSRRRAVGMAAVVAERAVLLGAQARDGGPRGVVEPAGFQIHGGAAQGLEGVRQHAAAWPPCSSPVRCTRGAYQV